MADDSSSISFPQVLGGLSSLAGLGLSASNQQGRYDTLQNALNVIGPTSLNGYTLGGPGGMSSGYNPNGGASIDLGSLNPAFSGLVGAGAAGAGAYSSPLLSNLTGAAGGTLNPALANLTSAYGGNNNFQQLAALQAGGLNQTYNSIYGNTLANMRAQAAPGIQQQAYGLQNTLFGRGVADSSGAASGSLAAANFGRGVAQGDASMQLAAQQAALSGMSTQGQLASSLSGTGNALLSNAFGNFGNTSQLISGLNSAQLNNSLSALQGAGALNTLGLNNYLAALQTGSAQATARNQSLFPYANVALGLSGTQNAGNIFGSALSGAGSSLMGPNGIAGLLSGLFGGGNGGNGFSAAGYGADNSLYGNFGTPTGFNSGGSFGMPTGSTYDPNTDPNAYTDSSLNLPSFSSAGGQAAAPDLSGQLTQSDIAANGGIPSFDVAGQPSSSTSGSLGLGSIGTGYGAYAGLTSGNPIGEASGALNAAKLAGNYLGNSSITNAAGDIAPGLGLYSGITNGGAGGAIQAAGSAAQLGGTAASAAGASGLGATLSGLGSGIALGPGLVYSAASLFDMLDPNVQMTNQQILAQDAGIPGMFDAVHGAGMYEAAQRALSNVPGLTSTSPNMGMWGSLNPAQFGSGYTRYG